MAPTLPRSVLLWQACLCLALLPLVASAQPPPAAPTLGEMKEIRPGVFNIGKMQLDKTARTLTFPGTVNMAKGALEYLLVSPAGATHESLLLTTLPPNDVHLAMLLLGAKGAGLTVPAAKDAPPAQITDEYLKSAPALKGDAVFLTVTWKDMIGEEMIVQVED